MSTTRELESHSRGIMMVFLLALGLTHAAGQSYAGVAAPALNNVTSSTDVNMTRFALDSVVLPPSVDWRTSNIITAIFNQMRCSSCWAVATADLVAMTWQLAAAHSGSATPNNATLSPQSICDCGFGECCLGGWPQTALTYVIGIGGLPTNQMYPYVDANAVCNAGALTNYTLPYTAPSGWGQVPAMNITQLMKAVAIAPALVFLSNTGDFWNYSGGVYNGSCSSTEINHAALVVGYGSDPISGSPFWIIKNSFGVHWGEQGYMRMLMVSGTGVCGVTSMPSLYLKYKNDTNPCFSFPPPCGSGVCNYNSATNVQVCACPWGYVPNTNGNRTTCLSSSPCQNLGVVNPCGSGSCSNMPDGSCSCLCPEGFQVGATAAGSPTCVSSASSVGGLATYTVAYGDTCQSVQAKMGLSSLSPLTAVNPSLSCTGSSSGALPTGLVLAVPLSSPAPPCGVSYYTQLYDSCGSISLSFQTSAATLTALNPGLNCSLQVLPPRMSLSVLAAATYTPAQPLSVLTVATSTYQYQLGAGSFGGQSASSYSGNYLGTLMQYVNTTQSQYQSASSASLAYSGSATCTASYKARWGDTCGSAASTNGLVVTQLVRYNPGLLCPSNSTPLPVGFTLCVNVAFASTTSSVSSTATASIGSASTASASTASASTSSASTMYSMFIPPPPGVSSSTPPPPPSSAASSSSCTAYHTVQQGDTCPSVWLAANLTGEEFFMLNPGLQCSSPYFQIGQSVCINGTSLSSLNVTTTVAYVTSAGDTLTSIASGFQWCYPYPTASTICAASPSISANCAAPLSAGTTLYVPCDINVGRSCGCSNSGSGVCGADGNSYPNDCQAACNYAAPSTSGGCNYCEKWCGVFAGISWVQCPPSAPSLSSCNSPSCQLPPYPPSYTEFTQAGYSGYGTLNGMCNFGCDQCTNICSNSAYVWYEYTGTEFTNAFDNCMCNCYNSQRMGYGCQASSYPACEGMFYQTTNPNCGATNAPCG